MSSEPPSENRPTGPPPGPPPEPEPGPGEEAGGYEPTQTDWSPRPSVPPGTTGGPSVPPRPPDQPPPGGGGPGGGGPEGGGPAGREPGGARTPWWRSKAVLVSSGVIVAAAVAVFFIAHNNKTGEIFLQSATAEGKDPFTASTAKTPPSSATASPTPMGGGSDNARKVAGSAPGIYGGSQNVSSCDVERQIRFLEQDQAKGRAFASVLQTDPGKLATTLRSGMTPVLLRADTRVTNHGFKDGAATQFQSVLQAGTAVLVDDKGLPRVRCACGNPLTPPKAFGGKTKPQGQSWPGYQPSGVVVVTEADTVLQSIVLYDPETGSWFERQTGTTGDEDKSVPPPGNAVSPGPSQSSASPSGPESSKPPSPSPSTPKSPSPAMSSAKPHAMGHRPPPLWTN